MRSCLETWSTDWNLILGNKKNHYLCNLSTTRVMKTFYCYGLFSNIQYLPIVSVFWTSVALCQPAWAMLSNTSRKKSPIFPVNARKKRFVFFFKQPFILTWLKALQGFLLIHIFLCLGSSVAAVEGPYDCSGTYFNNWQRLGL